MPVFDWTISFGNLLTVVLFFGTAGIFIGTVRTHINGIRLQLVHANTSLEAVRSELRGELDQMKADLKQLVTVMVEQGRQDERMNGIDTRVSAQGQRLDDLSRQVARLYTPDPAQAPTARHR